MLLAHFLSDGQTYSFSFFPSLCVCFYVGRTLCILLHAIPIAIATAAGKTDEGGKEAARPPNLLSVDQIWTKWNKLSSTSWKSRASWLRLVKVNSFSAFFISKLYVSSICFCTSLTFECVPFSHLPKGFQFNLPRSVCDCYVFHFFFIAELFFTPHFWRYVFVTRKRTYVLCVLETFLRKKVWHKEWCEKKQCLRSLPIHVPYSCKKKLTSSYVSSMHWWMRSKEEWAENNSTTISTVMIKLMTKITIVNKKYIDDLVTLSHYIYRFMHSK